PIVAKRPAVHDRHHQVEKDERRRDGQRGEEIQRLEPVPGADGVESRVLEEVSERVPDAFVVVHDEDQGTRGFGQRRLFRVVGWIHGSLPTDGWFQAACHGGNPEGTASTVAEKVESLHPTGRPVTGRLPRGALPGDAPSRDEV